MTRKKERVSLAVVAPLGGVLSVVPQPEGLPS